MSVPGPGVRGTACGALPVGTREVLSAHRVAVAPTRVPWRSARATDGTCPHTSRRSGLHLRGPQGAEEGAGDPGAVEQPAHTYGHGFPGHDAGESACERGGASPHLTSPTPALSCHLPPVLSQPGSSCRCRNRFVSFQPHVAFPAVAPPLFPEESSPPFTVFLHPAP